MAIELASIFVRTPTRIRCFFTDTVTAAPVSAFAIESTDGVGVDPAIAEALILQGNQVELTLSDALVGGGSYSLTLTAGLVHGGAPTAPGVVVGLVAPASKAAPSKQLSIELLTNNLFGEDIAWSGTDWLEGPDGDLVVVSGRENARAAVTRRMLSDGLAWDDTYGLKPSEFVDGPEGELQTLVARAETQALADDRIKSATAKLLGASAANPEQQIIEISMVFADDTSAVTTTTIRTA
jgi:hypothetical protein